MSPTGVNGLELQQKLADASVRFPSSSLPVMGTFHDREAMKTVQWSSSTKPFDDEDLLNAIRQAFNHDASGGITR